jgi:phosphatidate cytidylyltransferase
VKPIIIRTLSGGIYTLLTIASIFLGARYFGSLLLILLALTLMEMSAMLSLNGNLKMNKTIFVVAGILCYLILVSYLWNYINAEYLFLIIPIIFLLFIIELFNRSNQYFTHISSILFGFFYLVLPIFLLNKIYAFGIEKYETVGLIFGFFIIIWANDTFAYLSGMFFGRHKFFERISPKKTWEGITGGLIFAMIAAYVLSIFFKEITLFEWFGYAGVIVIFGTFGDLIESLLKRTFELKDSGSIMPGHGGILDRLDSALVAAPFALTYILLVLR